MGKSRISNNRIKNRRTPYNVSQESNTSKAVPYSRNLIFNPLANLSFEQSLNSDSLSQAIHSNLSVALHKTYGIQVADLVMQSASLARGGLLVRFSQQEFTLVQTSTGLLKAMTRDPATGQFSGVGTIDVLGNSLNSFTHSFGIVVAIAHIIINADMSKRLWQVQIGVDTLLKYQQIAIEASIRTAYETIQEELDKEDRSLDLIAILRTKFRECRHRLFDEAFVDLNRLKSDISPLSDQRFPSNSKVREFKDKMSEALMKINIAIHCLQMETLAAYYCGLEASQKTRQIECAKRLNEIAEIVGIVEGHFYVIDTVSFLTPKNGLLRLFVPKKAFVISNAMNQMAEVWKGNTNDNHDDSLILQ